MFQTSLSIAYLTCSFSESPSQGQLTIPCVPSLALSTPTQVYKAYGLST